MYIYRILYTDHKFFINYEQLRRAWLVASTNELLLLFFCKQRHLNKKYIFFVISDNNGCRDSAGGFGTADHRSPNDISTKPRQSSRQAPNESSAWSENLSDYWFAIAVHSGRQKR